MAPANTEATQRLQAPQAAPPGTLAPGAVVAGRYTVQALLGWGGQALVYRAADARRGEAVALKVVRADLGKADRDAATTALLWEGRLLQRLHHAALPFAVQLQPKGDAWLARELVAGRTLAEAAGGPCDERTVLRWALQLCDLLTYLHAQRPPVICGDIKPRNLVLRSGGALALIDLGAAQTLTRRPPRSARPRHGTPGYAAPEQLGAWGGDERSDLFSLAVTCYELLTGLDPAAAPLQFDLGLLDRRAPQMAKALRWALELDRARRPPTAAVLRAALGHAAPVRPLVLAPAVRVDDAGGLVRAAASHPLLLEAALQSGVAEQWLAAHPARALGALLHDLRAAQGVARGGQRTEALLRVLAPAQGAPQIQFWPRALRFGPLPLRRWRTWLPGQRLTLRNTAATPLRWELEGESRRDAEVRVWANGRALKRAEGVLLPGAAAELELVASGSPGKRAGKLALRCGSYVADIPWEGEAQAGLPVGPRLVERLADLDPTQPGLVPLLEALLRRGLLRRWLADQGRADLAAALPTAKDAKASPPDALAARLLLGSALHERDPQRFPLLEVRPQPQGGQPLPAGGSGQLSVHVVNRGRAPCELKWSSRCAWAGTPGAPLTLRPGQRHTQPVLLLPPAGLAPGPSEVVLELRAGALSLPVNLSITLAPPGLWQRIVGWIGR
jgi:hypothetical protein